MQNLFLLICHCDYDMRFWSCPYVCCSLIMLNKPKLKRRIAQQDKDRVYW